MVLAVENPLTQYPDLDGSPLDGGYVYYGVSGQNAETHPITVYWDAAGTQPAAQPIRTTRGFPMRFGVPARIYSSVDYSITIRDKRGRLVLSAPSSATFANFVSLQADIDAFSAPGGSSLIGFIGAGAGAISRFVQDKLRETVSILDYGAPPDGTTPNDAALSAALTYAATCKGRVKLPAQASPYVFSSSKTIPAGVSVIGDGQGTQVKFTGSDGFVFAEDAASYETVGMSRRIANLQVFGSDTTTSLYRAFVIDFSAASGKRVTGVVFDNVTTKDWGTSWYLRGAWNCDWRHCKSLNSQYGWYFYGQNVKNSIVASYAQTYGRSVAGTWGISFQSTAGESTQSTQILASQLYYHDVGIKAALAFETQIIGNDITECQSIGVDITTVLGGMFLQDNWIETNPTVAAQTWGVKIEPLAVPNYSQVHVTHNRIICQKPYTGSVGVSTQSAQYGATVVDNEITGFDIGVKNISSASVRVRDNVVDILTSVYSSASAAIYVDSLSSDCSVGPNAIIKGNANTHPDQYQTCTFTSGSANIVVPDSSKLPVGTPVQFVATVAGFWTGVQYYILTSAANVITLGATPTSSAFLASASTTGTLFASPDPVDFSSGTPPGLSLHASGGFHGVLTGFASSPGGPVYWSASGKEVSLTMDPSGVWSATSNATTMTLTGLPSLLAPQRQVDPMVPVLNNGTWGIGLAAITTSGTVSFFGPFAGGASIVPALTNTGTKGINPATPISYQLAA